MSLVGIAGLADDGVEFGKRLRLVLGFVQVADDAEAVGSPSLSHIDGGEAADPALLLRK